MTTPLPILRISLLFLGTCSLAACGSGGDSDDANSSGGGTSGLLSPPPRGQGIQLGIETSLEPGEEVEHCRFVQIEENLWVNRDEIRFDNGSHHVLAYSTPYRSIPTRLEDGTRIEAGAVWDCTEGPTDLAEVSSLIAGSQNADAESMLSLPDGVAVHVPAGTVVLLNAHYINTSPNTLKPQALINLWTIEEAEVEHEGGVLFWYSAFLHVGPNSQSIMRSGCDIDHDITLTNAQSHMHARGVGYWAELTQNGETTEIYANSHWENVPVAQFDGGLHIPAGSRIEYACEYRNDEARDVFQGAKTTDEMCMFIASYYPATVKQTFCSASEDEDLANLGQHWYGDGNASCGQFIGCISALEDEDEHGLQRCVAETDPAVGEIVTNLLRCVFTHEQSDPIAACASEIEACQQT